MSINKLQKTELNEQFLDIIGFDDIAKVNAEITSEIEAIFCKSSGVDINAGDNFSEIAGKICQESYKNSQFVEVIDFSKGNFRGPRGFNYKNLPEGFKNTLAPDGVGTKVVLHEALGEVGGLEKAAYDIVAMTGDDIVRYGGLPLVFTSILDIKSIKEREKEYKEMMLRLGVIAKKQGFVILNGETAEIGPCVGTPNVIAKTAFNWSGVMSGVYHPDKMITGEKIKAGNILVALKQNGFRSNGISAVRKAFELEYGENYYETAPKSELLEACEQSVPYALGIAKANGWYSTNFKAPVSIAGIAHLSGGSFKGKLLEDILSKKGLSAEFNNLFPIPKIVQKVVLWTQKSDNPIKFIEEIYSTWCVGQGMIIAVENEREAQNFMEIMKSHGIESRIAGKVIDTPEGKKASIKLTNIHLG